MELFAGKFRRECRRAFLRYAARGTEWHGTVELGTKEASDPRRWFRGGDRSTAKRR